MGFLKAILILLLVYYLFKILFRLFAPKLFRYAAKKTEEHFKERFREFNDAHSTPREQEGEFKINRKSFKENKASENVGEYIDFEEIE